MSQRCFYCPDLHTGSVTLPESEALHASKVLRLTVGEGLTLMDGMGHTANAVVETISRRGNELACKVEEVLQAPKPQYGIRLYLAPPRAKIMDLVVRFATELGVSRITPILCQYGVSKPDGSKDSWLQTAIVAMKQSRNPWLPILDEPVAFNTALASATECSFLGAVPSAGATCSTPNPDACRQKGVALWIGPEGGFSPDEENAILGQGACPLTVGPCILRVETAVPALLGALYTLLG